ncbi:phosphonate C-P lyase system protein PhnH [Roseibium marinum]|uniref:Alpha-D-ribose 1-methylphosphonate 5-triphosphate synthase subunit PhnH n=1 Tax=Roseibium marinum TaxID=281252 RepID=A0A2S3UYB9_9HYPH|nr:phosphonate C-P lyase system protein PhnH [Roseibium marinum]POF32722.1 alpha-D-ribose 1-methylphosphonate 5-triphosphate synthase subunit PhnH [Roseibium marinum]
MTTAPETNATQESRKTPATPPLAAGFQDPVHDAQACFRAAMNAIARPGTRQAVDAGGLTPPAPLTPVAAALALTLLDYDTPVWLDKPLMASDAVKAFLRFHTGAPIVSEPVEAAFALVGNPGQMIPLASFNQGSAEYPDRSATVILLGQDFGAVQAVTLQGPGIQDSAAFSVSPVPPVFWEQVAANSRQFPRGIDLIFAGDAEIAALPRSTRIMPTEV